MRERAHLRIQDRLQPHLSRHLPRLEQVRGLVRTGQSVPCTVLRAVVCYVLAKQDDLARSWPEFARDQIEQGRFSCAIGTEDHTSLAVRNVKRDIAYGLDPTKASSHALQAQSGPGGVFGL